MYEFIKTKVFCRNKLFVARIIEVVYVVFELTKHNGAVMEFVP
jgi:hypothetical protein